MPLSGKDDVVTWIRHFRKSDNKIFKGDDKKQRWKRAVAAWMKAKSEVKESLDTPKSYRKRNEQHYTFRSGGEKYTVDLTHFDRFLRVDFFVGDYDERITNNQGTKALTVLATVVKVVMDYLKDHSDIDVVQFEGNNDRYGVYKKIATVMSKRTGWKMKEVPYSSVTLFRFMNEETINELFDKPAKYTNMFNDVQKFDTKSGKSFVVFSSIENNMLDIAFTDGAGRDSITGMLKSESIQVFSTVLKIVKDTLAKNPNINKIAFGSSDDKSRSGLYKRIAEKFAASMKWKLTVTKSMFGYKYIIENPKTSIQESKELKKIASNKWRSPKGGFTIVKQNNGTFSIFRKDKLVGKGYKTIGGAKKVIATKMRSLKESSISFNIKDIPDEKREGSGFGLLKKMVSSYVSSKYRNSKDKAYDQASKDFVELKARKKNKTHQYLAARIAQTYDLDTRKFYQYLKNKQLAEEVEVLEEGRDAPLYHGCSFANLFSILRDNTLKDSTYQKKERLLTVPIKKRADRRDISIRPRNTYKSEYENGVSLSRKFWFSAKWSDAAVLEFDQRSMVRDGFKLVPFHYFESPKSMGGDNEFEEFLIGPLKNVKKYTSAIYLHTKAYEYLETDQIEVLKNLGIPVYEWNFGNAATAHKKKRPIDYKKFVNSPENLENTEMIFMNLSAQRLKDLFDYGAVHDGFPYNPSGMLYGINVVLKRPSKGWNNSGFIFQNKTVKEKNKNDIARNIHSIDFVTDKLNDQEAFYIDEILKTIKANRWRIKVNAQTYEKWKETNKKGFLDNIANSMTFFAIDGFISMVSKNSDLQWFGLYKNDATPTDKEAYVVAIFDHSKLKKVRDLKIEDNPYNKNSADIVSKTKFHDLLPAMWYITVRNPAYMDPKTLKDFMNLIKFNPKIVIQNIKELEKLHSQNEANKEDAFEQDIYKIPETITIALGWISFRGILKGSSKKVMLDKTTTGVDNLKKEQNTVFSFRLKDAVKDGVVSYNSKLKEVHIINENKAKNYIKVVWLNPYLAKSPSFKENYNNVLRNKMIIINKKEIEDQMEATKEEFAEEIEPLEEGRDAPLYHTTNIEAFLEIISKDTMRGFTTQTLDNLVMDTKTKSRHRNNSYDTVINGISTTRQYQFAKRWADYRYKNASVIIEFDQRKLTHNHKMVPIDFWETPGGGASDEFEEFVLGDIKYFSRYVRAIYVYYAGSAVLEWAREAGIPVKNIQTKKIIAEEAPTTNAGGGMIAGIGVGPNGEPGGKRSVMNFIRRKKKKPINNKKDET